MINLGLSLLGNALGLLVANWVLDDMSMTWEAWLIAVLIFTGAMIILQPLILKMSLRYGTALGGSSALISTFFALLITTLITNDLNIDGATTWLLATVIVWLVSMVVGLLLTYGLRWLGRRINFDLHLRASWRSPVVLLAVAVAARWVLYRAKDEQEWTGPVSDLLDIAIIGIIGWIALLIVHAIGSTVMERIREQDADSRGSRRLQTKVRLLERVAGAIIITITVGAALWTLPAVQQLGATILASAGIIGVVAGIAAQSTLGNLFAGLQLAFTDAIRIDDIVDIGNLGNIGDQWGRVDEITLSYVVVRVWDGTSLILPCTYFTTTGF